MNIADLVSGCKEHAWYSIREPLGDVPTMLSHAERAMLHWLAREYPLTDRGAIVDAGCFLGGSTTALASGLARRIKRQGGVDVNHRIHTYDMFIAPNDRYSLGLIGHNKKPGDTTLDLFGRIINPFCDSVFVYAGDFMIAPPPINTIDIFFLDLAKTRELNSRAISEFFPKLIPGRSILIQQDYNDHSCGWVNATMELLTDYFEVLCNESSSRVFINTKMISPSLLATAANMSPALELELLESAIRNEIHEISRYFTAVGAAWTIFELRGRDAAVEYLNTLPFSQPWQSDEPYRDLVKNSILAVNDTAGLEEFHQNFFAR